MTHGKKERSKLMKKHGVLGSRIMAAKDDFKIALYNRYELLEQASADDILVTEAMKKVSQILHDTFRNSN